MSTCSDSICEHFRNVACSFHSWKFQRVDYYTTWSNSTKFVEKRDLPNHGQTCWHRFADVIWRIPNPILTAANWVSFDFNVSYSSCWGYSLINTLKLKTKIAGTVRSPDTGWFLQKMANCDVRSAIWGVSRQGVDLQLVSAHVRYPLDRSVSSHSW